MFLALNEKWTIGKIHPLGDTVFESKDLFVFQKNRFLKAIKPRDHVGDDIVFTRNEAYVGVELFDLVELTNDMVGNGIIGGDVVGDVCNMAP